ncbi:hypothetical protein H8356DRAFT_1732962 [Neocallimastix lanati (nom. inval.)]|jgi:hypothetical protein|uniref:Uncharacterized protein n=1 Tax=Neocallimastix californiae TaxID=1754190 RepID=A0A1Y2CVU8_9FUNG|nr:hypothetical protein H8356DRAFT_1732962 [Neocallimastix sp. JGI-2020a]ORY51152.1 hypothetical protein LY90DRAFT_702822 [Neocallimastix californiae]|eukprot:ORY51152.1 hypothetical protein LY90DRAFT_702822 [Neocallimastix californiae]
MSEFNDFNIFDFEASLNHNSTIMDDDFIGGTSIIIIGIISFIVVIIIIIAIHLFSKKLNSIDCENGYQQFDNPLEEMEPLPEYEERETRPDGEVDLSDYIQANNTINTIPRDTMNIINILNSNSQRNLHVSFTDTTQLPPPPSPTITDNYDGSNNSHHDHDHQVRNDDYLLSIPSTSILPLPRPKRESIPNIPPPCYDIALTQPRISNQGMIVLPQDPSFATNLPTLLRNSSSHRHILRRSRQRLIKFFTHHRMSSPLNNNYRLPSHSSSVTSHSSIISSGSSNSDSNLNPSSSHHHDQSQQQHHHSNDPYNDNRSSLSINRRSRNHVSRSRAFLNRLHPTHLHASSIFSRRRRHRSNLLRFYGSTDNDSISSVSIYPTTMIDIPEDHYNISGGGMNYHEVRNNIIPEIERGCTTTATSMIPCINDNSAPVQSISMAESIHSTPTTQVVSTTDNININSMTTQSISIENRIHTPTLNNMETHQTNRQASSSSSEVLNNREAWVDVTQYNPSLINHEEEDIINFNSVNVNNSHYNHELNPSSKNDHTPSIPNEYGCTNTTTLNNDYHQIIINDEATPTENEKENKNKNEKKK